MKRDDNTEKPLFDRRSAMKFAAAAGAGAAAIVGAARSAMAQSSDGNVPSGAASTPVAAGRARPSPGWHRFKLGEARVTTVLDGLRPGDGPHPTFGANQPPEAVAELMRENLLPERRFVNGFTPVIVEIGGQVVLFDTGFGEGGAQNGMGKLVERMGEAGYSPADVSVVVLTHFHGDHIAGLMRGGQPTFANARYVAGQREYEWWTSDEAKASDRAEGAAMVEKLVVPLREKMTLVKEGDEVVPGIRAMEAFGHSPGMMIFEVASGEKRLWLTADTANHFVASLQRPDWEVRFDQDKPMAAATRKRVFDRLAEERLPFIGYHMPFPSVGFVQKLPEGGYRFVPESYQFDVDESA